MAHRITQVEPGSPGEKAGIRGGESLIAVDNARVLDFIDYQMFTAQPSLTLTIQGADGEVRDVHIQKPEYLPLGLVFEQDLMSPLRRCANQCVFCFVDQLPEALRQPLYVKDDDWRMSMMMGNYVTLTNVSDRELDRIIERRAGPLYISVHAMDGPARARMMGQPRAAKIRSQLERLAQGDISFHTQVVLCPGMNDGEVLEDTIASLAGLRPHTLSLSVVPVGLTGHRKGLHPLRPVDRDLAGEIVDTIHRHQARFRREDGAGFVYGSDELYILAERPFPPEEEYDGYPQIENGVGMFRLLIDEFKQAYANANLYSARPRSVAIITGTSAEGPLQALIDAHPVPGVTTRVYGTPNQFFGRTVTVAGLLTGEDVVAKARTISADELLLTRSMLREGGDQFLDDIRFDQVEGALPMPVTAVGPEGADLLYAIMGAKRPPDEEESSWQSHW